MLAGLIIASAIITSSLVVGDSLDATVGREVQAAYGETDVLIAGFDPMTGVAVAFDEGIGARYWASLQQNTELADDLRGRQFGLTSSVSLSADSGLAEPSVSLFAHNATIDGESVWQALDPANAYRFSDIAAANEVRSTPGVAINAVAAEALEVGVGDALELARSSPKTTNGCGPHTASRCWPWSPTKARAPWRGRAHPLCSLTSPPPRGCWGWTVN